MGIKSMLGDLGVTGKRLRVKTDASVAKCLASWRGLGGIRHIEVNQLWLQEKVNRGEIEVMKVKGVGNLADALTKPLDGKSTKEHIRLSHQAVKTGRHELTPSFETAEVEESKFESEQSA